MNTGQGREKGPVRREVRTRAGSFCRPQTLIVGLTGGIATGKTTVAQMFRSLGAHVLSADDIAHKALARGSETWKRVVSEFGREILDPEGNIDRKKLGDIVFREPRKLKHLESIVHPPVLDFLGEEIERFRATGRGVLIVEIPLLVETGSFGLVDKVLVVRAEQETQIQRLQKRYGVSRREAVLRIRSQLPIQEKVRHADWVIGTEGTLEATREQVEKTWDSLRNLLAQCG